MAVQRTSKRSALGYQTDDAGNTVYIPLLPRPAVRRTNLDKHPRFVARLRERLARPHEDE